MSVRELHIHSLRNLHQVKFFLHPEFNIFYGINGSGKTSLLEALYLLSAGYSFKTRETVPLIRYGDPHLTLFARTFSNDTVSIRKLLSGPTQVFLNSDSCKNSSILARLTPCLVFYQDIFQIIDAGPSVRRSLMDWGVFHVKHEYHDLWRNYRQVLKQRNAVLRQKPNKKEIYPWDMQLIQLSFALDKLRQEYFDNWKVVFQSYLAKLSELECTLEYYRGWRDKGADLGAILEAQFTTDCQRQYTQSGAHQADIYIKAQGVKAKQGLSRGQQKIILIALKLAQAHLLESDCLYLFDDLCAELDETHIKRVIQTLKNTRGQKVITTLDDKLFYPFFMENESAYFNVVEGSVHTDKADAHE
jgi:DNA replication and repair protein RecF